MIEYSDQEIIECLRNRQSYVVRYLSDRYLPMVRLMVYQLGGTGEDAKDIFQDSLIIIIEKIDSGEFELTCKFKTFFYSVCENLWKSVISKRKAAANYLIRRIDEESEHDFTEIYDTKLFENVFYDVFNSLDEGCKKLLKLYWQDFSPSEIAEKLGFTYGYLRKKKCHCMSDLMGGVYNHPDYKSIKLADETIKNLVPI